MEFEQQEIKKRPGRPKKVIDEVQENSTNIVQEDASDLLGGDNESPADTGSEVANSRDSDIERIITENLNAAKSTADYYPEPVQETHEQPEVQPDVDTPPDVNGWNPISTVPHTGFPVKITDDVRKEGVVAYWRMSRAFANATHRWESTGFWTESDNGRNIDFVPKFWKERFA